MLNMATMLTRSENAQKSSSLELAKLGVYPLFGEDRPKDLGGVEEQTNKQTNVAQIIV